MKKLFLLLLLIVVTNISLVFAAEQAPIDAILKMDVKKIAIYCGILFMPGFIAINMTVVFVTLVKIINRANGDAPLNKGVQIKSSFYIGAVVGVLSQFSFQKISSILTGMPVLWELFIPAFLFTGAFSCVYYEVVKAIAARREWTRLLTWLEVKHD